MLKIARFLKIARLWRLGQFIKKVKEVLDLNPAIVRMAELLGVFVILAHWLACGMFWSGTFYQRYRTCNAGDDADCKCYLDEEDIGGKCTSTTWTTSKSFMVEGSGEVTVADMDCNMQYLMTFYWTITTMTTVGYGDISPLTFYEFFMNVLMQIAGVTVFGFMVGNMSTLASMLQGRHGQLKEKLDEIQAFLQAMDVPKNLEKRVVKDMDHLYKTPNVIIKRDIIDAVPLSLAAQVSMELFQNALHQCPIFDGIQTSAKETLYLCLKPFHVAQGDIIANPGEVGHREK